MRTGARATIFMTRGDTARISRLLLKIDPGGSRGVGCGVMQRLQDVPPLVTTVAGAAEATGRLDVPRAKRGLGEREADHLVAAPQDVEKPAPLALRRTHCGAPGAARALARRR